MAQEFNQVHPGDLITSSFMNSVLNKLETLEDRVAALEAGGGGGSEAPRLMITEVNGPTPLRVGDPLTVKGVNFAVPAVNNEVKIGGVAVTSFGINSGATQLTFVIPEVPNLSPQGSAVTLNVKNKTTDSSDSKTLTLRPAQSVPSGFIQVLYKTPPVLPLGETMILANRSYIFSFEVAIFATQQGSYTFTPQVTGATGWTAQILNDNNDQARTTPVTISVPGNDTVGAKLNLRVKLTIPTGQANGITGTLQLNVVENTPGTQVMPGGGQLIATVGQPPPTPETRVRISLESAEGAATIVPSQGKVNFNRALEGGLGTVGFSVRFTEGGQYNAAVMLRNTSGWTFNLIEPQSFNVQQPAQGQTTNVQILAQFTAGQSAAATEMLVTITKASTVNVQHELGISVT